MTHPAERTPLLPCPFCGGKAAIEQHGTMRQSCIIACEDCSCRLETGEVFDMGRAWNTRHSQGESSTEPAAWLVCWHRANGDSGLDAYVNEDAARRAAKNLEAYSASETMADVQPLYTAPTPSPAESVSQALAKVPNDLYWLIGKGKTHESEPLYACQIISPSDGTVMAEAEHDNLAKSITMAVSLLSREGHDPDAGLPTAADVRGILSSTESAASPSPQETHDAG